MQNLLNLLQTPRAMGTHIYTRGVRQLSISIEMDKSATHPIVGYSYYSFGEKRSASYSGLTVFYATLKLRFLSILGKEREPLELGDHSEVSLSYGIELYGRFMTIFGLDAIHHFSDFRIGLRLTRRFVLICYLVILINFVMACMLISKNIPLLYPDGIPGLTHNEYSLVQLLSIMGELTTCVVTSIIAIWIVRNRDFIYDFIFCSDCQISVSRTYQRNFVVILCLLQFIDLICSEPFQSASDLFYTIDRDKLGVHPKLSLITKIILSVMPLFIISYMRFVSGYISAMNCFVSYMMSEYLNVRLIKNVDQLYMSKGSRKFVPATIRKLNSRSEALINKFALHSISDDWPSLELNSCRFGSIDSIKSDRYHLLIGHSKYNSFSDYDFRSTFMRCNELCYRRATRILSKLRCAINAWDEKFASISPIFHCLQVLSASHILVVLFIQVRSPMPIRWEGSTRFRPICEGLSIPRYCLIIVNFIVYITSTYLIQDKLPARLIELRCKMFAITMNYYKFHSSRTSNKLSEELELQLAWKLYDHVNYISHKCTMEFAGSEVSKRTMWRILAQVMAFLLLYVQIVDVAT